jgi:hypothetical protein
VGAAVDANDFAGDLIGAGEEDGVDDVGVVLGAEG